MTDLADVKHWDEIYRNSHSVSSRRYPKGYEELTLEHVLLREISRCDAKSLLEVGCGNSFWLPYLATKTGAIVSGVDYSEEGCKLARQHLAAGGVPGRVFCADLFQANRDEIGQHDFVFSLGVVEHFTDLNGVLSKLLEFVNPGGVLFTEVPNILSIHGALSWIWQPQLLAKHKLVSRRHLVNAYKLLGMENIRAGYFGLFSLNIVAWEVYPRWPGLVPVVAPLVRRINSYLNYLLCRTGKFRGISPLAPFLCVVGHKSAVGNWSK